MTAHKMGFVALVGRPNAGKSTLLNQLLGQKLAITSNKPQTTRNRLMGVLTQPDRQVILIDTPGMHKARSRINKSMVRIAQGALEEADVVCWLIDVVPATKRTSRGGQGLGGAEEAICLALESASNCPKIVVALNKVDQVHKPLLLPILANISERLPGCEVVPISALRGIGMESLVDVWAAHLPEAPPMFPEDTLTDASERFIVSELIREKIFRSTHQEVPYDTCVEVEKFLEASENNGKVKIYARILVGRDSQKGILIGKGGAMLKSIGTRARKDIQGLLGVPVHLELHVTVQANWADNPRILREQGIE
jgi:GTP-binding protein Era